MGSEVMKRESDFGTVETGKIANLLILDKDPSLDITNMRSLEQVMRAGKLHKVSELKQ